MPIRPASFRSPALLLMLLLTPACASTGATFRSGVGDRFLERPPYYAGAPAASSAEPLLRLPIAYQRGAGQSPIFEPDAGEGSALAGLLAEMNAYLDTLLLAAAIAAPGIGTPPDVMFGCELDPTDDCDGDEPGFANDARRMRLAVGRPSSDWIAWLGPELDRAGAGRALVLTLEIGQYYPRQTNLRGDKVVDLGTGHAARLPWLTSLEQPVQVLQLTGALVGRDGKALRIGAEGLLAKHTNIVMSGFGAQALIADDDVRTLRESRRTDLAGEPLVWRAALRELVAGLGVSPTSGDR